MRGVTLKAPFAIIMFEPQKNKNHPEHYCTFLEMCESDLQKNIDQEMPSVKDKQLVQNNYFLPIPFSLQQK